jgi:D-serine deaminase-like pyridoxal phosphate-dependent protein
MGRVGVQSARAAVELARSANGTDGLAYRGIMLYPGHIRTTVADQGDALREVSHRLRQTLDALFAADLEPPHVSGGSTPTLWRSHEIAGLTEVRPGTSIFNDRTTALLQACGWTDCAYSVLATVVSTSVSGNAVVDAGSKALAREEVRATISGRTSGYGCLHDEPEITVAALSEEHGVLDLSRTDRRFAVGQTVRIIPNHVCVSVNLNSRLYGVRDGRVVDVFEVTGGRRGGSLRMG